MGADGITRPVVMRRARTILSALAIAQIALLVGSLWLQGLGTPEWHHHASLGFVLVLCVVFWRRLTGDRRFVSLVTAVTTLLAVLSGFFILYEKPFLKAEGLVDWIKWWHILWSWAALAAFAFHTWLNRVSVGHFLRGLHARPIAAVASYAFLVAILAAVPLTWNDWGIRSLDDSNYIRSTWMIWIALVAPPYIVWAAITWTPQATLAGLHAFFAYHRTRAFVDVALIPATLAANLSGFPITYWKEEVHAAGFKFLGKIWHTAPSIVMAVLVFVHTVQLWGPVKGYWQRVGR